MENHLRLNHQKLTGISTTADRLTSKLFLCCTSATKVVASLDYMALCLTEEEKNNPNLSNENKTEYAFLTIVHRHSRSPDVAA